MLCLHFLFLEVRSEQIELHFLESINSFFHFDFAFDLLTLYEIELNDYFSLYFKPLLGVQEIEFLSDRLRSKF